MQAQIGTDRESICLSRCRDLSGPGEHKLKNAFFIVLFPKLFYGVPALLKGVMNFNPTGFRKLHSLGQRN